MDDSRHNPAEGWLLAAAPQLRNRLFSVNEAILFLPIVFVGFVPPIAEMVFGDLALWGVLLATLGYLAIWFGVIVLFGLWRARVWVNLATGQMRVGRKVTDLADIDSAILAVASTRQVPSLSLLLRAGRHIRAVIPIRHRAEILLTDERRRRLLADLLKLTRIEVPTDQYDPQKKFARYNFPGFVDRETAIELVLDPPEAYAPLPVSY